MKEKNEQLRLEGFEENKNAGRIGALSRTMRRNMTREERKLYNCFFKVMNIKVERQKVIGPYIADFFVPPSVLVELDGSQHYTEKGLAADRKRDEYLTSLGYTVIRYSDNDVNRSFEAVCEDILRRLGE